MRGFNVTASDFCKPSPEPHFFLSERMRRKKIYTNRSFDLSRIKKEPKLSLTRNDNLQIPAQSLLWKKIDKLDEYIEEHSMKVYKKKLLEIQQKKMEDRERRKKRPRKEREGSPEAPTKTGKFDSPATLTNVC